MGYQKNTIFWQAGAELCQAQGSVQPGTQLNLTFSYEMNPDLSVHEMYTNKNISEFDRLVATRIRLSSHELAIEKGRWSRTPRESRLCNCGEIQTEVHVVCFCPFTDVVRASYPELNFQSLEAVFKSVDSTKAIRAIRRCYELVIKWAANTLITFQEMYPTNCICLIWSKPIMSMPINHFVRRNNCNKSN